MKTKMTLKEKILQLKSFYDKATTQDEIEFAHAEFAEFYHSLPNFWEEALDDNTYSIYSNMTDILRRRIASQREVAIETKEIINLIQIKEELCQASQSARGAKSHLETAFFIKDKARNIKDKEQRLKEESLFFFFFKQAFKLNQEVSEEMREIISIVDPAYVPVFAWLTEEWDEEFTCKEEYIKKEIEKLSNSK